MKRKEIKRTGFTLVELLVVISIIAILLAILMPSLNKARGLARRIVCGSHTRNMFFATASYAQTYGSLFPVGNGWKWSNTTTGEEYKNVSVRDEEPYWAIAYVPFGAKKEMFRCPAKKKSYTGSNTRLNDLLLKASGYSDYTMNGWVCWKDSAKTRLTQGAWPAWKNVTNKAVEERKLADFKRPASMILLHDGYEPVAEFNPGSDNGPGDSYLRPKSAPNTYSAPVNLYQWRKRDTDDKRYAESGYASSGVHRGGSREYWRHNGTTVILWLDGHSSVLKETTGENIPADWYTGGIVSEF